MINNSRCKIYSDTYLCAFTNNYSAARLCVINPNAPDLKEPVVKNDEPLGMEENWDDINICSHPG